MTWIGDILRSGKTVAGATLAVLATLGRAITPEELTALQGLLHGADTLAAVVMSVGLLHKLLKAKGARS